MTITKNEERIAERLVQALLAHQNELPYINIQNDEYKGWVSDFHFTNWDDSVVSLDLKQENDLFLLFALAIAWSRPGPWENAAYFINYLKKAENDTPKYWLNEDHISEETENRKFHALLASKSVAPLVPPRKQIAFRKDLFNSMHILAAHWNSILSGLQSAALTGDYFAFMSQVRNIAGLGSGNKRILIKIPLLLRELRCQHIYDNIPGKWCCVVDQRVLNAARTLHIDLVKPTNLKTLIASSEKIYALFGDLYDLPLFAYEDIQTYL